MQMEKEFTKQKARESRQKVKAEAAKKLWEEKILKENGLWDKKGNGDDDETKSEQSEAESVAASEASVEEVTENVHESEMSEEEFNKHVMELKEEKFLAQRNPFRYHREMKSYDRMKLAMKLSLGMKGVVTQRHMKFTTCEIRYNIVLLI